MNKKEKIKSVKSEIERLQDELEGIERDFRPGDVYYLDPYGPALVCDNDDMDFVFLENGTVWEQGTAFEEAELISFAGTFQEFLEEK